MVWEEEQTGARDHVALLFVVPESALQSHWGDVGLADAAIDAGFSIASTEKSCRRKSGN